MTTDLQPLLKTAGRLAIAAGLLAALFTAVALTSGKGRDTGRTKVWYGGDVGDEDSVGI
jgi:hypothetical protein